MLKQRSFLATLIGLTVLAVAPAAMALQIEAIATPFTGDQTSVKILLTESGGDIVVNLKVNEGHGDLRGVFMNLGDQSLLDGIHVTGADVTDFATGDVKNLGNGANITGTGSPCPCDIGVEIGLPGSGGPQGTGPDLIEETTFTISHDTIDLLLDMFAGQTMGIRVTNVGPEICFDGSSKLSVTLPQPVPEPTSAVLIGLGLGMLGLYRRRA